MKIGILTFTEGTNIGQRLQNYALQKVIEDTVNNCEVLTIKQTFPFNNIKRYIKELIAFLRHPKIEIIRLKRKNKFSSFNKKHIRFCTKILNFHGDNTEYSKQFDCFVVGSDQVWNPNSPYVGANYFLTFAKRHQRLTYAPSFSIDELPVDKRKLYKEYLNGFSNITVREDRGAQIVHELTGTQADVVLDPTLLLKKEEYDEIKVQYKQKPAKKYMLSMFLGVEPKDEVEEISKKHSLNVFWVTPDTVIGPDEFLDVVENAELVVTDSYHVTIFSIIYCRPFINFVRSGNGATMNSRFETLYRILNINNRTWAYLKCHPTEVINMKFDKIYMAIELERERCKEVLKRSLDSCKPR